jgi:putative transposase
MAEVQQLATKVGTVRACRALAVPRSSVYRWRGRTEAPTPSAPRPSPARALAPQERKRVLDVLHSERFVDQAPREVYATLLDEEKYLCSIRTMYRLLAGAQEVRERRDQLRHPEYKRPELLATRPNQVWSWDISKLMGPAKWSYYYLYVILDIFSRYVVGWMVAAQESAALAEYTIAEACRMQGIESGQLTLHADRGPSMKSKAVALLLSDLGVTKTHSRPYTSTDNPYSESHFKTLKYRPTFPERFGSIEDARAHCRTFFGWYNREHRHGGIALLTPEVVHYGRATQVIEVRRQVLVAAYGDHPERFVRRMPSPSPLPDAAWINPPKTKTLLENVDDTSAALVAREGVLPGATPTVVLAQ